MDLALGESFYFLRAISSSSIILKGPFDPTYHRSLSVDFSSMVTMGSYDIIIPLNAMNDVWSFINPFTTDLWILSIISIPLITLAMAVTNYLKGVKIDWAPLVGFVLRNILSENLSKIPDKYNHQKILTCIWMLVSFILVTCYAGNLTAMISTPNLDMKFNRPVDLLHQDEITLIVEDGIGAVEFMSQSPPGSTMSRLLEKAEVYGFEDLAAEEYWDNCFTTTDRFAGNYGAMCDIDSIRSRMSYDFTMNGKCNWYKTEKNLFEVPSVMVFQVCTFEYDP